MNGTAAGGYGRERGTGNVNVNETGRAATDVNVNENGNDQGGARRPEDALTAALHAARRRGPPPDRTA